MRLHPTVAPSRRPWRRAASIVAGGLGLGLSAGWIQGCSLLYELETEQCSSNADCDAMGDPFTGLACVNHLCEPAAITGCQSNAECIDTVGNTTQPYACLNRECVALTSNECPQILPLGTSGDLWREALRADNKALILAGTGLIGDSSALDPFLMNYDLALTEVTNKVTTIGGHRLVMIGCKAQYESSDDLDRMMVHIADEVKAPGMIAAMGADDLQRAFEQKGDAANMFFMNPLDSDPTVAALSNLRSRIWDIGPGGDFIARAYAPLLQRTITYLNPTAPVKVGVVTTTDIRLLTNMLPTIQAAPDQYGLSFNGKSVADNRGDDNYRGFNIDSNPQTSVATQVQGLIDFQPTVIISAADTQFVKRIIPQVEAGWPPSGPPRPFYFLSPYNYNDEAIQNLISTNPTLARRIAGANGPAALDSTQYDSYIGRWQDAYPASRDLRGFENFYDAAYYLLYAVAGAGQAALNGDSIATGMTRLLGGPNVYSVGPDNMVNAFSVLAAPTGTIQLNGTLGPPEWNRSNGTRETPGSVFCIDQSGAFHADVLRYSLTGTDPTQATLTGTFPTTCIPGF